MKVQQTLAQTWKRRRDSDHAEAKRLIAERGVGLLAVPNELLDIILGFSHPVALKSWAFWRSWAPTAPGAS